MKIAILGAGSLGTVLGAYLAKEGLDVDLVTHNQEHLAGLKETGAQIIGKAKMIVKVNALSPEELSYPYDVVFLMTKQLNNKEVLTHFLPYLKEDGVVVTMQNGLPEISVSEVVGEERTLGCSVAWGATLHGKGVSELTSEPDSMSFSLGRMSNVIDDKVIEVKNILEKMCPVVVEKNFIGSRFSKLLINAAFSGMSAVTGGTFGEASKNKASRLCIQRIIKECIDVSKANGIEIEPVQGKDIVKLLDYHSWIKEKISFALIPLCIKKHASLKASMLQDLEKGKKTEVDSINGIVSFYGKKANIKTPYNDMVVTIVHRIENGELKPSFDNVKLFNF